MNHLKLAIAVFLIGVISAAVINGKPHELNRRTIHIPIFVPGRQNSTANIETAVTDLKNIVTFFEHLKPNTTNSGNSITQQLRTNLTDVLRSLARAVITLDKKVQPVVAQVARNLTEVITILPKISNNSNLTKEEEFIRILISYLNEAISALQSIVTNQSSGSGTSSGTNPLPGSAPGSSQNSAPGSNNNTAPGSGNNIAPGSGHNALPGPGQNSTSGSGSSTNSSSPDTPPQESIIDSNSSETTTSDSSSNENSTDKGSSTDTTTDNGSSTDTTTDNGSSTETSATDVPSTDTTVAA